MIKKEWAPSPTSHYLPELFLFSNTRSYVAYNMQNEKLSVIEKYGNIAHFSLRDWRAETMRQMIVLQLLKTHYDSRIGAVYHGPDCT